MSKKTVMITGVAGMIGSHFLDKVLKSGKYTVVGVDNLKIGTLENIKSQVGNPDFKFYKLDILDFDSMKILGRDVDIIVHLAAEKKIGEAQSSIPTLETNTQGTKNIFELAKMWGSKVIYASTSDVYGMSPDLPLREDGDLLLGPSMIKRWSYAVSKLYGEQLAYAYYYDYKVPMVVLRYFGGFSHRANFAWSGGHLPIFISQILKNESVTVHGDGTQTRSMSFVEDIVDGTMLAMESEAAIGEIINLGNDEELSVVDTARLIHEIAKTGHELKIDFIPMSELFGQYKDILRRIPDMTKAKKLLGYAPKVKLRDA
ncbi:MAG: NAD-dependent epimerase/dehydratase family protein, partial [Bdellovibrionota bacterium]